MPEIRKFFTVVICILNKFSHCNPGKYCGSTLCTYIRLVNFKFGHKKLNFNKLLSAVHGYDFMRIFNSSIFNDLSWNIKLLLFKDYFASEAKPPYYPPRTKPTPVPTDEAVPANTEPVSSLRMITERRRIPGIEYLKAKRRQDEEPTSRDPIEDDNTMRIKLFRLMYETVRDSDLKCKRAELIRSHYANSSAFAIGFLMGEVMDKYNIMNDISTTAKRLFHEWKPIEHINAYEQISNQAIEINHVIDIMRGIVSRRNQTTTKPKT